MPTVYIQTKINAKYFSANRPGPQLVEDCFRDNTAYYGNNLNNPRTMRTLNTIDCQLLCQNWTGGGKCRFWSWDKVDGRCYIKKIMDGEEYDENMTGDEFTDNPRYVTGSRDCKHVVR